MKFIVRKPVRFIDVFRDAAKRELIYHDDVIKLYDMLPDIIQNLGFDCSVVDSIDKNVRVNSNTIFLGWHSHGKSKNVWWIKDAYLPNYFYFDKMGYSGWSELVETYNHDVDIEQIREEVQAFARNYIDNNTSRYNQSYKEEIPNKPYVLVFEQRPDDAVADFAYVSDLTNKVKKAFKDTKYQVHVKPHPLNVKWGNTSWEWTVNEQTGSLHELISNSSAVYTVNSSAGFEALLHNKRVFTAGQCDYHWATNKITSYDDIVSSIKLIDEPVDVDNIMKFVHYCITQHFMTTNDVSSIERKLLRAADEFKL